MQIIKDLVKAQADLAAAKKKLKKAEAAVTEHFTSFVRAELDRRAEPFGTVNVQTEFGTLKFEIKKKVDWDQDKLASIWARITTDLADPTQFMKREITYTVPETQWKQWGDNTRAWFVDARTVSEGTTGIKFEPKEDNK